MNQDSLKIFFFPKGFFIWFCLTCSCADQKALCSAELISTSDVHVQIRQDAQPNPFSIATRTENCYNLALLSIWSSNKSNVALARAELLQMEGVSFLCWYICLIEKSWESQDGHNGLKIRKKVTDLKKSLKSASRFGLNWRQILCQWKLLPVVVICTKFLAASRQQFPCARFLWWRQCGPVTFTYTEYKETKSLVVNVAVVKAKLANIFIFCNWSWQGLKINCAQWSTCTMEKQAITEN